MNDSVEQFALVYSSPNNSTDSPMSDNLWPPPNPSPPTAYPSPPFQVPNPSTDHPSFSPQTPSFSQHASPTDFSPSNGAPSSPTSDSSLTQVESSIGPTRALPRRQRSAHTTALHIPSRSNGANPSPDGNGERSPVFFISGTASRPQSPTTGPQASEQQPMDDRINLSLSTSMTLRSPHYPSSPVTSPVYTTYGFNYPSHSRSNSDSHSGSNPRSASPALSVTSNVTTDSSSGSGPNLSQAFSSLPQPVNSNLSPIAERQKQRKQRLFNVDRKAICIYHLQYPNARQEDIAQRYGVERSTISKILKHKTKWMNVPEAENLRVAKHRPSKFPDIEEELVRWLVEATRHGIQLTDASIRAQAKLAAQKLRISEDKFKASSGWIENFKHRHGIRKGKWEGKYNSRMPMRVNFGTRRESDALPPLAPAFEPRTDSMSEREYDGLELASNGATSPDGTRRAMSSPSSLSLHSPWQRSPEPGLPLSPHTHDPGSSVIRDTVSQHSMHHQHHPHAITPPTLHLDLSQPSRHISHHHHHHHHHPHSPDSDRSPGGMMHPKVEFYENGYDHSHPVVGSEPSLEAYHPVSPIPASSVPSLEQAEDALNKVIMFVDAQPRQFLRDEERECLSQIKIMLYQIAHGVS